MTLEVMQNHDDVARWPGFTLRTFDPASGEQTWEWKSQSGYDLGVLPGGPSVRYHANWVDLHDEVDGATAYVSLCDLYLVLAVDVATGGVKWVFGPGGDFTLYGDDGALLPDDYYSSCQHGLEVADGNRLLVYDNGWERARSRVVEFELDHDASTATQVWSWSEPEWHEPILGDADWLPDDHVLLNQGHSECYSREPGRGRPNQIVEVDKATGGVAWRLTMPHVNDASYRAERIGNCAMFSNAKYCAATRARLGELKDAFGR
jgi:hypothetical protein